MNLLLLLLTFQAPQDDPAARADALLARIRTSGVVLEIAARDERLADPRKQIAPGAPPLLAFRYFQGADRHRFSKLDLMLDDAGH